MIRKLMGCLLVLAVSGGTLRAQSEEERTVEAAREVLREIMSVPAKGIPASLLADAQGVVIVPDMLKGGFIVGVRHGKGVILTRNGNGEWIAPVFVTVAGGSIGFQAGVQATDVITVFRNRQRVDRLMHDKFTIGADAAVAAGPVGREVSAATDAQLRAEILSYSRSRGLFAGVAIDGATIQVDHRATAAYYAPKLGQPQGTIPASAAKLVEQLVAYAGPVRKQMVNVREVPSLPTPPDDVEAIRVHLIDSSLRLQKILDPKWREYLALPAEAFAERKAPGKHVLATCVEHYETVSHEARYQALATRPEFRETHALLLRYRDLHHGHKTNAITLPAPPR